MIKNTVQNYNELDFVKLNETLANPEFANWYYNQFINGENKNININMFVDIVKTYAEGAYK